jgi:hypothetical protein
VQIAISLGSVVSLVVAVFFGPVAVTLVTTAIAIVAALRFARASEPPAVDPTVAGPWASGVLVALELVIAGCVYVLGTSLPPPEDLGPANTAAPPAAEVVHPSGERSRLVDGDPAVIERVTADGVLLARMPFPMLKGLSSLAMLARGERLGVAVAQPGHYITYGEAVQEKDYLTWENNVTVALHAWNVKDVRLAPSADGVEIRLFAEGFLHAGTRVSRVLVPDGTVRRDPGLWYAALPPRRTALFDLFPGLRVLLPLAGPVAGMAWLASVVFLFRRRQVIHRIALLALPLAAFSAILLWAAMGLGM